MTSRVALYPGTFDPPHLGHLDVITRASKLFDHLVVAIAHDSRKDVLFDMPERAQMLRDATKEIHGVEVAAYEGLTATFAKQIGAQVIVRGLRGADDLGVESQQAAMNRHLSGIDTIFLVSSEHMHVSSTLIREVVRLGGDPSAFVPEGVALALRSS